ncbi:hypothetical protein [Pseudomonas cyclaminis]|uniref:hypothetical protein n=1 Tax=Pseudomonas cyclaminis TaxID=2781239 RepID=UPI00380BBA9E
MSKSKQDTEQLLVADALPVSGLTLLPPGSSGKAPAIDKLGSEPTEIGPPSVFRDKVYTSRTLIMPDGRTLPVVKGLVTAFGDDQHEYLSGHPDLELATE